MACINRNIGEMFGNYQNILSPDLWWVRGEIPGYNELFIDRVMEGVRQARNAFLPAKIKFARAIDGRCAFNRRFIMREYQPFLNNLGLCDMLIWSLFKNEADILFPAKTANPCG